MENESYLEFLKRIDGMRRRIPCTCRNCGAKFTYMKGFSMRECSIPCYLALHPWSSFDERTHRIHNMKPNQEEFNASLTYMVAMRFNEKMLEANLISIEEYFRISFAVAEKIAPPEGTFFSDGFGEEKARVGMSDGK